MSIYQKVDYILSKLSDIKRIYLTKTAYVKTPTLSTNTYTLTKSDNGALLYIDNGSATTIYLPNNLQKGFNVGVIQYGAGQITFSASSGAVLRNSQSHTKTSAQYAVVSLFVASNTDNVSAVYMLGGETAS